MRFRTNQAGRSLLLVCSQALLGQSSSVHRRLYGPCTTKAAVFLSRPPQATRPCTRSSELEKETVSLQDVQAQILRDTQSDAVVTTGLSGGGG